MFEPITLTWDGREYVIPADQVMRAIAIVEEHITLGELGQAGDGVRVPLGKISMAFGALLRFAGARVTDAHVYEKVFSDADGSAAAACIALISLMMPPEHLRRVRSKAQEEIQGNADAPSSKRRTSRP
jgi:hypothetical protein